MIAKLPGPDFLAYWGYIKEPAKSYFVMVESVCTEEGGGHYGHSISLNYNTRTDICVDDIHNYFTGSSSLI